ncbi:MAG: hypothetical protein IJ300_07935 [Clostridia bacterium]|nr:hypothetical protein [Clostridia bacterium]
MNNENKKLKNCTSCGKEIAVSAKTCPECGAKNKKPFYKRLWFIILAIIVIIAVISNAGDTNTNEAQNTTNTQEQTQQEPIEYTSYKVDEMIDDLEANALNAENKYTDKHLEITGKLSIIDSDGKYISLAPVSDAFAITSVQCYIKNDEQKSKVLQMSTGDTVTLKGKITSVGEVLGYSLDIESIN